MLNSLSSCRKIGPFPRQHPFGITDLVQISGIESQQLGYKILAPRGLFTVVGSYRDSDIAGTCGLRQDNQVVIEEDFLGLIFFWIYLISTLDSSSFSIFTIFLSLSLSPAEEFTSKKKNWWKNFLKSVAAGVSGSGMNSRIYVRNIIQLWIGRLSGIERYTSFIGIQQWQPFPPWRNKQGALTHPVSFHSHLHSLWSNAPLKPTDISSAQCAKRNTIGVNNFTMLRSHSASLCVFNLWLA